jgi:hypothetical protein
MEPQTLTGLLTSYRFCDCFSASFGIANTVGAQINERPFPTPQSTIGGVSLNNDAESYKAYAGSFALTAPDSWGFLSGSTFYSGVVSGFGNNGQFDPTTPAVVVPRGNQFNYYAGATVATPVTGLRFGAAFDYMNVYSSKGETYSVAGYASMQATEKLSFHLRGEFLKDSTPVLFGPTFDPTTGDVNTSAAKILALTATVQYDLWKNVISRLEVRWDHSLTDVNEFGGSVAGEPSQDNAWMLAANVIYKF